MGKIKWYFAEVVLPKYIPAVVVSVLGYVVTFMLSHAKVLEQWGITTGQWPLPMDPPSGMVTLIEWATLGTKTGACLTAFVTVSIVAIIHHMSTPAIPGGRRGMDPPAATPPQEAPK